MQKRLDRLGRMALAVVLSLVCFASAGPRIVFDMARRPFPDIPFPNDLLTRQDADSPTGRRLQVPTDADTAPERRLRAQLLTLDGFSTYGPIVVSFDAPLDVEKVRQAHALKTRAKDPFAGNAVYVVNVDKKSRRYGEAVPLDLGDGNFPVVLEETKHFTNDTRADSSNLLFETVDEQQLGRDTNYDGRIFRPNMIPRDGDPYDDLLTFYDLNTNTLIIRVLFPLEERSRYAVILTNRLVGEDGEPVTSPFGTPYHPDQKEDVEAVLKAKVLKKYGLSRRDVAFAWVFSTQSVTADLVAIREGLYGHGPFKKLKEEFPLEGAIELFPLREKGRNPYLMEGTRFSQVIQMIASALGLGGGSALEQVSKAFLSMDYMVMGTYETPYFLHNESGTDFFSEEVFHVNTKTGSFKARKEKVHFVLCVPKATPQHKPPFPVVFIGHGYTMNRLMAIPFCALFAQHGLATFGIDAAGHGASDLKRELDKFRKEQGESLVQSLGFAPLLDALAKGRDRDLSGDGVPDSGGDFFTAYVFHTRDMIRQTIVDFMQATRILRAFDGKNTWSLAGKPGFGELAGDFDGDGKVDVGGPDQFYAAYGISLGGILTSILPGVEPAVKVSIPVVGGGGLVDIGVRSLQGGVPQGVTLRLMGPLVVNVSDESGDDWLTFHVTDVNRDRLIRVAKLKPVREGDKVVLKNETKGTQRFALAGKEGRFRLSIPADEGDRFAVVVHDGESAQKVKQTVTAFETEGRYQDQVYRPGDPMVSPVEGFGLIRNTPEYRDYTLVAQMVLDPADPINYAPHYFLDPLDIKPDGKVIKNVLVMPTAGDMNVPVNTGIALARAAGLVPLTWQEATKKEFTYGPGRPWNEAKSYEAWWKSRLSWEQMDEAFKRQGHASPTTPNQILLDYYVIEGLEKLRRFGEKPKGKQKCTSDADCRFEGVCKADGLCYIPILADSDDLAEGRTGFDNPRISPPLRITRKTSAGVSGLRIPYGHPAGSHFFNPFEPPEYFGVKGTFDLMTYMVGQVGHYLATKGKELFDDACLEDASCQ